MIKFINWKNKEERKKLREIINRGEESFEKYFHSVSDIIKDVKTQGDEALFHLTYKFDKFHINGKNCFFDKNDFKRAYNSLDNNIKDLYSTIYIL